MSARGFARSGVVNAAEKIAGFHETRRGVEA